MISPRKLEALRNLAERPGTEAEGRLAREILARLESSSSEESLGEILGRFGLPTHWKCACGSNVGVGEKCNNQFMHSFIQQNIRDRFKKGDRVYYNRWAYEINDPAVVTGYVKPAKEIGDHPWAWIRLKFDLLKNSRAVPIYSNRGWNLSHEPLPEALARILSRP